ncbi:MAG: ABC transporter ATP-binding protein/permease [Tatlockia sp.]|nr:ABC transporter ATP-binding protein/permease [Tatlockia sp.]
MHSKSEELSTENPLKEQENHTDIGKKNFESSWSERFKLIKDYFVNSDEKWKVWLLVGAIVLCIIGFVALNVYTGFLFTGLWATLTASTWIPFLIAIGKLAAALLGLTILDSLKDFLKGKLIINWRDWLTNKFIKLIDALELKRTSPEIKNISQRIQEDIKKFVYLSVYLSTEAFKSSLSLLVFMVTLWIVGGTLAFVVLGLNIVIPGYLVWIALIIAIAACVITYYIGKPLPELNQKEDQAEADLRQDLDIMYHDAENIALERTELYHFNAIETDRAILKENANKKLETQTALGTFQTLYTNFSTIIPYLVTAPLYFIVKSLPLDSVFQVGMAFSQVSYSLGWFAKSYEQISFWQTKMDRIIEIQHAIEQGKLNGNPQLIDISKKNINSIKVKQLSIFKPLPSSTDCIIRKLNLELKEGEHTLIGGNSGSGKSTLLKVLSNSWLFGKGKIRLPKGKTMFYLPQIPSLPNTTFKGLLSHPDPVSKYTTEEYIKVIRAIKGMDNFIAVLDKKMDWSILSGGQRQRISFAKALLKKPDWLFLDEVSAFLDEESENYLYKLLRTELTNTTIVSIAHRSTVKSHHHRLIKLGPSVENVMEIIADEKTETMTMAM